MANKPVQGEKRFFMTGNEVVAWGALAAGADIMYGYPITPQNEVMHYWTRLSPKYGRKFLQTEDEISAGFTTCGGVMAGKKSFTATAGPGNVLMQEPMGMAEAMRLPTVTVIQQRGGPSSGTVIYSQQEVTLTTFGGNGEGHRIVYSTSNHQEMYDYMIKSFNVAWKYRFPVFLLGDGYQAKMREPVVMYDPEEKGIEMVQAEPFLGKPGKIGVDRQPSNLNNIYSTEEELYDVVMKFSAEYEAISPEIVEYQTVEVDDVDILIVTHGVVTRAALDAVAILRSQGVKAGLFRPITLRPFPEQQLREVAQKAQKILLLESAYGQLLRLVKEALYGETKEISTILKPGVGFISEEIVEKVLSL